MKTQDIAYGAVVLTIAVTVATKLAVIAACLYTVKVVTNTKN